MSAHKFSPRAHPRMGLGHDQRGDGRKKIKCFRGDKTRRTRPEALLTPHCPPQRSSFNATGRSPGFRQCAWHRVEAFLSHFKPSGFRLNRFAGIPKVGCLQTTATVAGAAPDSHRLPVSRMPSGRKTSAPVAWCQFTSNRRVRGID